MLSTQNIYRKEMGRGELAFLVTCCFVVGGGGGSLVVTHGGTELQEADRRHFHGAPEPGVGVQGGGGGTKRSYC